MQNIVAHRSAYLRNNCVHLRPPAGAQALTARDRAKECIAPPAFLVADHQPRRKNREGNRHHAAVSMTCRPALISPMSRSPGCHGAPAISPWRDRRSPIRERARIIQRSRVTDGREKLGGNWWAQVADIAAGNAFWVGIQTQEKIPTFVLMRDGHVDFPCGQGTADGAVDPGEREFESSVGSASQFDFDGEASAVFFEPVQKCALDHWTGHWQAMGHANLLQRILSEALTDRSLLGCMFHGNWFSISSTALTHSFSSFFMASTCSARRSSLVMEW